MSNQYTHKEYNEDEIKKIISLYNSGVSFTKISKILHRKKDNIKKILIDNNVFFEGRDKIKFIITNKMENDIIFDYVENGKSTTHIGKKYGLSKTPIIRILKEKNLLRDGNSNGIKINLTEEEKKNIKSLYLGEFKSPPEISKITGLNVHFVRKHIKECGYTRSKGEGTSISLVKRFTNIPYNEFLKKSNEFEKYKRKVVSITKKQPINKLENFNKRGVSGIDGNYHLDHKFSIAEGFKNKIEPQIIGSIKNLEFIPWMENLTKRTKCTITMKELKTI